MGIISQYSRLSHHTVTDGSTFSVPSQEDFTLPSGASGSWTVTDLALSEIGVDELNNKAFIRIGSNINEFIFSGTSSGATPSLSEVLLVGNDTQGTNLILGTGSDLFSYNLNWNNENNLNIINTGDTYFESDTMEYQVNGNFDIYSNDINLGTNILNVNTSGGSVVLDNRVYESASVTTTNDTTTTLITIGTQPDEVVRYYKAKVTGIKNDNTLGYYGEILSVIRRDGTLNQVSTIDLIEKTEFTTATSTIDFSGTDVRVRVTGEAATTINWRVNIEYNVN